MQSLNRRNFAGVLAGALGSLCFWRKAEATTIERGIKWTGNAIPANYYRITEADRHQMRARAEYDVAVCRAAGLEAKVKEESWGSYCCLSEQACSPSTLTHDAFWVAEQWGGQYSVAYRPVGMLDIFGEENAGYVATSFLYHVVGVGKAVRRMEPATSKPCKTAAKAICEMILASVGGVSLVPHAMYIDYADGSAF